MKNLQPNAQQISQLWDQLLSQSIIVNSVSTFHSCSDVSTKIGSVKTSTTNTDTFFFFFFFLFICLRFFFFIRFHFSSSLVHKKCIDFFMIKAWDKDSWYHSHKWSLWYICPSICRINYDSQTYHRSIKAYSVSSISDEYTLVHYEAAPIWYLLNRQQQQISWQDLT